MSSPAPPARSRSFGATLLNVAAGDYGSLPNLALFIAILWVALCVLPAGGPLAILLTIRDIAALGRVRTDGLPAWLIRDLIGLGGVATAAYLLERAFIRIRAAVVRAVVVALITFCALAFALGAPQWFVTGDGPVLLALGSSVAALLFLLLCTCRTVVQLVLYGHRCPAFPMKALACGLAGSATLVSAAASVAWICGLDLSRLDDAHIFYVLAVPAMAGFGLFSPKPPARSRLETGLWLTAIAGLLLYSWPLPFLRHARMECDWDYEKPHHVLFGFEGAPWHWEGGHHFSNWAGAPAALGELTITYVTQPLVGLSCAD